MEVKNLFDVLATLVIAWGIYAATSAVVLYPVTNRSFWKSQSYWSSKYSSWRDVFATRWASLRQTRQQLATGYEQYSRAKKQFVLPQLGADPVLLVPKEQVPDMLSKLDSEHAFSISIVELTAAKYTGDEDLLWDPHKTRAIKHRLNRRLPLVIDNLYAEIVKTFEAHWKTNGDEWTPQRVYPSCMDIVSRTANRVISGEELCRNYDFLFNSRRYTETKFGTAMFIRILPHWVRALIGHAIAYPHKQILNKALVHVVPVIEERLKKTYASEDDKPNDVLQWLLDEKEPKLEDKDAIAKVSRHLLMLNSAAIHTTTISITNAIFDLFTSPRCDEFVAALREECETVLAANNGEWTTKAVGELRIMDSMIKESMRMSPLGAFGLSRVVEDKNGVDFNGQHLPKGVRVAVAGMAIHRDPDVYPSPDEFNAFRFVDAGANSHITDTAPAFLPFGHGRHSCPGRFFASMEMKLVFAHMLTTYDIRVLGPRPKNWEFAGSSTPLPKAECQIRPRQR